MDRPPLKSMRAECVHTCQIERSQQFNCNLLTLIILEIFKFSHDYLAGD